MSELCIDVNTLKYKSPKVEHPFLNYSVLEKKMSSFRAKDPKRRDCHC